MIGIYSLSEFAECYYERFFPRGPKNYTNGLSLNQLKSSTIDYQNREIDKLLREATKELEKLIASLDDNEQIDFLITEIPNSGVKIKDTISGKELRSLYEGSLFRQMLIEKGETLDSTENLYCMWVTHKRTKMHGVYASVSITLRAIADHFYIDFSQFHKLYLYPILSKTLESKGVMIEECESLL
jgi:hypothetical protein